MAEFIGTNAAEDIFPTFVSRSVTRKPAGAFPGDKGDIIRAGGGNDRIKTGNGNDLVYAGAGNDRIDDPGARLWEELEFDSRGGNDRFFGEAGNDIIFAGSGNDHVDGGSGNDNLYGGLGNDTIIGGAGADYMMGGWGNDVYYVDNAGDYVNEIFSYDDYALEGSGYDIVYASVSFVMELSEVDHITNEIEKVVLTGTAAINATGNEIANELVGNGAANDLSGYWGDDLLIGGGGNDTLRGGAGKDTLRGQDGADTLQGFTGADVLIGGKGNDVFYFHGVSGNTTDVDVIKGGDGAVAFEKPGAALGDRIDLKAIDADLTKAGDQAFKIGGTGKGFLSITNSGTDTLIRGNIDNDSAFEFALRIQDGGVLASAYTASDFIL